MQRRRYRGMRWLGAALAAVLAASAWAQAGSVAVRQNAAAGTAPSLPRLQADPSQTTVSGLSSGGFMAVQFATAFSARVRGVAVVAGGPYDCAVAEFGIIERCMTGRPSGQRAWDLALGWAAAGQIDPVANIARQRIYLFSGTHDTTVLPRVVDATHEFYRAAGVPDGSIAYLRDVPAGHAFLSATFGAACGASTSPYVERCDVQGQAYDQPRAILEHLLGALAPPAAALSTGVRPFDQREFAPATSSLAATGQVYVPAACHGATARTCRVHIVFHGCRQGAENVGDAVFAKLGFNRWADTNRVVVLYPQVAASEGPLPYNPRGCWDWWGSYGLLTYTGPAFPIRSGAQMAAVKAMVDRLTGR